MVLSLPQDFLCKRLGSFHCGGHLGLVLGSEGLLGGEPAQKPFGGEVGEENEGLCYPKFSEEPQVPPFLCMLCSGKTMVSNT